MCGLKALHQYLLSYIPAAIDLWWPKHSQVSHSSIYSFISYCTETTLSQVPHKKKRQFVINLTKFIETMKFHLLAINQLLYRLFPNTRSFVTCLFFFFNIFKWLWWVVAIWRSWWWLMLFFGNLCFVDDCFVCTISVFLHLLCRNEQKIKRYSFLRRRKKKNNLINYILYSGRFLDMNHLGQWWHIIILFIKIKRGMKHIRNSRKT